MDEEKPDPNDVEDLNADDEMERSYEEGERVEEALGEVINPEASELEKARAEAAEYLDNWRRLQAEFENYRKRMVREQSEFLKLASQGLIEEILPVLDNFERALEHEVHGDGVDEYKAGLKLVYSQLLDVLAKEGLSMFEPVGQPFDPTRHEAVMQKESDEYPEGTIVQVLEKGYVLKDRIIRPAKVTVAK